jgi:hypothetical protein
MVKQVSFLSIEDGDDLIVSFALGDPGQTSLTLLRTPKFEPLLPEDERGVSVDVELSAAQKRELLVAVQWGKDMLVLETTAGRHSLNLRAIDAEDIAAAKAVLRKMNVDGRFRIREV